jgi:hypothetical protein
VAADTLDAASNTSGERMNDLIAITVILAGFIALVFLSQLLWLGLRYWLICGSFASGHRIIDAKVEQDRQALDDSVRRGFAEAQKRGWIRENGK